MWVHRRQLLILFTVGALTAAACAGDTNEETDQPSNPSDTSELVESGAADTSDPPVDDDPRWLNGESAVLFDQAELRTFELVLADEDLAELDSDPAAEEYVEGDLWFDGELVAGVGIRYKGSVGAFVNCLDGGEVFNPSGAKTCTKLSMKVKINWGDEVDRTFYGVRKLQFHANNLDPSLMNERLAYWTYRQMGIAAPRAVHARLVVNGEFVGVFTLVEEIDGRFARHHFDDGTGNVYKEAWPIGADGEATSAASLAGALKTNEEEADVARMVEFGNALAEAGGDNGAVQAVLAQWIDIDEAVRFFAVEMYIAHDDGPLHFYCRGAVSACAAHNYFWYEDPSAERFHLVPWDMDNAFQNIIGPTNPVTPLADGWGEITNDCQPFPFGRMDISQWSAACDILIGALTPHHEPFTAATQQLANEVLSAERVDGLLSEWSDQIRDSIEEAAVTHPDAVGVPEWDEAVAWLIENLDHARENA